MAVHLGLGMNLLPPPSTDARILAGVFGRAYVTGRDGTIVQSGGTGGSVLCPWTGATVASGGICGFTLPVPGGGSIRFCHAQGQRINLFLNSNAPATQNITVGTGSVTISAVGSGYTLTSSAGTATATGYGAVTMGTPQVLTVTVAGTITLTVGGTPVGGYVNVEQNAFPGVKIVTAGTSVTRTADNIIWTPPAALSAVSGEVTALAVPYAWSASAGAQGPHAYDARIFQSATPFGAEIQRGANDQFAHADAGGSQVANIASLAVSSGTTLMRTGKWDGAGCYLYRGSTLAATDSTVTNPWVQPTVFAIGNITALTRAFCGAIGLIYVPGGLTDTERAALARYFNGKVISIYG